MRTIFGAVVVVLGMAAASPALADGGATAPLAMTPILASLPASVEAATPATSPFRLGATIVTPTGAATDKAAPLFQHRRGTSMVDLFADGGDTGFHVSGGSRLFQRRNIVAETEQSAGGIMAGPRAIGGATTTKPGFKKFNPAVTAGYAVAVSRGARIGVEAGAMASGAFSNAPGLPRFAAGYRGEHEFRPDAIVNATFGLRF